MIAKKKEEPQRVGVILEEILSERGYLTVCKEYGILRKWPTIAPVKLAEVSSCERIEDGILYVKVASAPWRQEAVYLKENILRRIQQELGCPTIKEIVFY
jgi:predicted nucleic acid-binding Zn ribbon protein